MMVVLNSDGHTAYACDTYYEKWAAQPPSTSVSSLTQVTLWLCGEFALRNKSSDVEITLGEFDSPIDETKLLGMIDRILTTSESPKIKSYALTTLAKLYPRCAVASNKELIRKMMRSLDADVDVEIQTRSVEYGKACSNASNVAEMVFGAVPKLEGMGGGDELDLDLDEEDSARDSLDLTALLSLDEEATDAGRCPPHPSTATSHCDQTLEGAHAAQIVEDRFRRTAPIYADAFLRLYVEDIERYSTQQGVKFTARYERAPGKTLRAFRVQAAVPKQLKLRLDPPSGTTLDGTASVTQRMSIEGTIGDAIVMKVRLNFEDNGERIVNVAEVRVVVR